jgi:hypothetical protein
MASFMRKYTIMKVTLFKQFQESQEPFKQITVVEYPPVVYKDLINEGIDVQVYKLYKDEPDEQLHISFEEADFENKEDIYFLQFNLVYSKIQYDRFNELLEKWGVDHFA